MNRHRAAGSVYSWVDAVRLSLVHLFDECERMSSITLLTVTGLAKYYGVEQIFENVSFRIGDREKVAIVGPNGTGKSTLLKIIAGREDATKGSTQLAAGNRLAYLPQEATFRSGRSVREEASLAFAPVIQAAERMRELEASMGDLSESEFDAVMEEYAHLQHRFETHGGYSMEHRTEEILTGLGFGEAQLDQAVTELSGGQRTRVALAKALLSDPDLLLLDEPTNHLDLPMLEWLEAFLGTWGAATLVVSHDRYFLDRVTERTLDLGHGRLEDYGAPYSGFLKLKEERIARQWKEYEEQQEHIARTEEFIRKYKAGQRSREARGRQTKLDRLERVLRPDTAVALNLNISAAVRSGDIVIKTSPLKIGFPRTTDASEDSVILRTPELTVRRGDRIGLIGDNGSGKTTLLRALVKESEPIAGLIDYGTNVRLGYYAQAHEQLGQQGTPLSTIIEAQSMGDESARNYLGRFLFSGDDVLKPVSALSGGERSRLALGVLLLQRANFLVLDEPTNHLDIMAREALEGMLNQFDGTILFVSHDRYFVDRIATKIWTVENGTITETLGNYSDAMRRKAGLVAIEPVPEKKAREPEPTRSPRARASGDGNKVKSITKVEKEIARLESRLNSIADDLAVAEIDQNYDRMSALSDEQTKTELALEDAYALWDELASDTALEVVSVGSR